MNYRRLCTDLDSYIYRYRASRPEPMDPPSLRLSPQQRACAIEWGTRHPDTEPLRVSKGRVMSYKGIVVVNG